MIPLFLGLTGINLLTLAIATALGYAVSYRHDWTTYHQLAGALAAILCVVVHCVVFSYFMATSKWIAHAIAVRKLDDRLSDPARSFKKRAFPAALLAMAIVFVTAVVGVATLSYRIAPIWHHALAIISLLANIIAAVIEYRAIAGNGMLIDDILAQIARARDV